MNKQPNWRVYDLEGDGCHEFHSESVDEAITKGLAWLEGLDISGLGGPNEYFVVNVTGYVHRIVYGSDGEIDYNATDQEIDYDCSTTIEAKIPGCPSGGDHDWQSPFEVVGGTESNPGCWSTKGTAMHYKQVCAKCGSYLFSETAGAHPDSGEAVASYRIEEPDAESLSWVAKIAEK